MSPSRSVEKSRFEQRSLANGSPISPGGRSKCTFFSNAGACGSGSPRP